jgi:Fe2+ or Zn2+ uptake regulation protein
MSNPTTKTKVSKQKPMERTPDIEQQKLLRLFKMIWLMSQKGGRTIEQLMEQLDIKKASVYRYLDFLNETDFFKVEKRGKHRVIYDVMNQKGYININFGEDELQCISDALNHAFPERDIARGIQAKLFQHLSFGLKSQSTVIRNTPLVIRDLHQAMRDKRQVSLEYFSGNEGQTFTRIIEPLDFTELHRYLIIYDAKANVKITNLKTSRIKSVEILTKKCTQSPNIIKGIDVFDIACYEDAFKIVLDMSSLAYRLLIEEYPRTEPCFEVLSTEGGIVYRFTTVVYSFLPISRFIMGLPGMIRIVESDALILDIQNKMKKFNAF